MKKIFTFLCCTVFAASYSSMSAQATIMEIWKGGSVTESYKINDVDSVTFKTTTDTDHSKIINGHKFIDLGLPSGLLWAETNIGAATAYDDGDYFAWGETVPKSTYSDATYTTLGKCSYSEIYERVVLKEYTKYTRFDGKTTLELNDDAACFNWGSGCRMPTKSEMLELSNESNCTWTWVSCTNSVGETIGCYKVVSVKNGNVIYLPASGYRDGDDLNLHGSFGNYWSSTLYRSDVSNAYNFSFHSGNYFANRLNYRYCGLPVRPVARP